MADDTVVMEQMEKVTTAAAASMPTFLNPLWTILLGIITAVVLFEIWLRNSRKYKLSEKIPCPPRMPVIGNGHLVAHLTNAGM